MTYTFMWSVIRNNADLFYRALYNTAELALVSILIALPFSIICALLRTAGIRFVSRAVAAYVMFIRATPLLVQVYFIFFGLPYVGVTIPDFWCGVIALVLNSGAYLAEIVRGGLESIPKGHIEASRSLGLSSTQTISISFCADAEKGSFPHHWADDHPGERHEYPGLHRSL